MTLDVCNITRAHERRSIKFVQKTGDKISNGSFNVTNKRGSLFQHKYRPSVRNKWLANIALTNVQHNFLKLYALYDIYDVNSTKHVIATFQILTVWTY